MNNGMDDDRKTHRHVPRSLKLRAMHALFWVLLASVGCLLASILTYALALPHIPLILLTAAGVSLLLGLGLGLPALFLPESTTEVMTPGERGSFPPQTAEAQKHALIRQRQAGTALLFDAFIMGGGLLMLFRSSACDDYCLILLGIALAIGLVPTLLCLGSIFYWRVSRKHGQEAAINPTLLIFMVLPVLMLAITASQLWH